MTKRGKGDTREEQANATFQAGCLLVRGHPLFGPLYGDANVRRSHQQAPPGLAWATVDRYGTILCNPHRITSPEGWAYIIAHALLHLGFGHCERTDRTGAEWNVACCAFVARFLDSLKFGEVPNDMGGDAAAIGAQTEERLHEILLDQGIPPGMRNLGTGHGRPDMVAPDSRQYISQRRWQALFEAGLNRALNAALEVASGDRTSLDAPMRLSSKARRARDWIIASYPLLGGLAAGMDLIEDAAICQSMNISIAAVSAEAKEIYLNPQAGLEEDELRFVIAHELLHVGLRHDTRQQGRDGYLWNVACDYVINAWLVEMRLGVMPGVGALYDPTLVGESAESVYDRIASDLRTIRKLATFRGKGLGDMIDPRPGWWARGEGMDLDGYYRRALTQGLEYHQARSRGLLPSGLVEEIKALDVRPIPWDVQLARWFDLHFPPPERRRTYARLSRRQSAVPDIPLARWVPPSAETMAGRTFGVVLDTSGSMDRITLARALGAIASYSLAREVPAARVVFCDAAAYDEGYMAPEAILDRVRVRGRGGTVLQPGIDLLERAKDFPPTGPILIITDGFCDRLSVRRDHAYLLPTGRDLPFPPRGPVFRITPN